MRYFSTQAPMQTGHGVKRGVGKEVVLGAIQTGASKCGAVGTFVEWLEPVDDDGTVGQYCWKHPETAEAVMVDNPGQRYEADMGAEEQQTGAIAAIVKARQFFLLEKCVTCLVTPFVKISHGPL